MRRFWSGMLLLGTTALPAIARAQEVNEPIETKEDAIARVRARTAARADRDDTPRPERTRVEAADRPERTDRPRFDRPRIGRGFGPSAGEERERPAFIPPSQESRPNDERPRGQWRGDDRSGRPDWRQQRGGDRRDRADRADRDGWNRGGDRPRIERDDRRPDRGWEGRRDGDRWWERSAFGQRDRAGVFRPWDRDWRRDGRYDWNGYRQSYGQRFRLPRYYAPSGWSFGYRRFGLGASLSPFLYDDAYWIDDPWSFRLPDAYEPYRWVRYYGDALLVDLRTGRVVDVVYGIFW